MSDSVVQKPEDKWGADKKEKWVAVQQAIHLSRDLGSFIGTIVGPMASELGGLLGDQMKAWRAANLDRIARKWEAKRRERSIPVEIIRQLPFRDAIMVLDAASLEDEDDIQELWARLILNATDINARVEIIRMHIDILKNINPLEARILILMFEWWDSEDFSDENTYNIGTEALEKWPKMDSEDLRVALLNLQRMGILTPNIDEMAVLEYSNFDEWQNSVNEQNIIEKFRDAITSIVVNLTNYSGNPMNDSIIPNDPVKQIALIRSYSLTRIGCDLCKVTGSHPTER